MKKENRKLWKVVALIALFANTTLLSGCGGGSADKGDSGNSLGNADVHGPVVVPVTAPTPVANPPPSADVIVVANPTAIIHPAAPLDAVPADKVLVQFSATIDDIPNPERGFYRWAWSDLNQFSKEDGADAYANGFRIVYAMVRLDAYKNSELPASLLTGLRTGFSNARQSGLKIIPRFVYNYPNGETEYSNATDAPLSRVLAHITQLKPVLQENSDVIAFLQAGFIGAWGEWHTSSNGLASVTNRTSIRDALLDALPKEQFIQFRYPPYVMEWFTAPLVEANAFNGSAAARSGVHNDCFLASATDVGTYSDNAIIRQQQRDYTMSLAKVTPFGGETCNPVDEAAPQPRTSCADILAEGKQFSLTYLNNDYYTEAFHTKWKQQACYDEVKRLMGYRLELLTAEHPATATAGGLWSMHFAVRNVGWARPYKAHPLGVLLKHRLSGKVVKLPTAIDPRFWTAGNSFTHDLALTIPPDTLAGEYDIYIALPDSAANLNGDARYAVRPANANNASNGQAWDPLLGAFRFGTTVFVR